MIALEKNTDHARAKDNPFPQATDIPIKGASEPKRLQFSELVPATHGLTTVFKRSHNYLHVNGNLSKERAFFELLRLIFCKLHDEQESGAVLEFSVTTDERRSDLGQRKLRQRIDKLFESVKDHYPTSFPMPVKVSNSTIGRLPTALPNCRSSRSFRPRATLRARHTKKLLA